jgi:hypothetical protein
MEKMEKQMHTSAKLLPLIKKKFKEGQDSLIAVKKYWDKHRTQLVYLGEKVIQMDNWQDDRFTQTMMQLQQDLVETKKALTMLQVVVQENKGARKPSIVTAYAITMTETTLVSSPYVHVSQEQLDEFKKHMRGIGCKIIKKMGYDGHGLGKRRQDTLSPIVVIPWANHDVICFYGRIKNSITMKKTIFMKETDMPELDFSSGDRETIVGEGVSSPPPHSCGRLKERSDEESL